MLCQQKSGAFPSPFGPEGAAFAHFIPKPGKLAELQYNKKQGAHCLVSRYFPILSQSLVFARDRMVSKQDEGGDANPDRAVYEPVDLYRRKPKRKKA